MSKQRHQFHPYPRLFPELKREVRGHCSRGTLGMLALTCKAEYALAPEADLFAIPHALLLDLASDGEARLLRRTLMSPTFAQAGSVLDQPDLHEMKHVAMRACHLKLAWWLIDECRHVFEWQTCPQCVRWSAHTDTASFIYRVTQTYTREHAHVLRKDTKGTQTVSNILTVEFIRMNNVLWLKWLDRTGLLRPDFAIQWDAAVDTRDVHMPFMALDAWEALVHVRPYSNEDTFHPVIGALFECMIIREWSLERMVTFANEHIQQELYVSVTDTDAPATRASFLEFNALRLFYYALVYKKNEIIDATWPALMQQETPIIITALIFLRKRDMPECTLGRRLMQQCPIPPDTITFGDILEDDYVTQCTQ